MCDFTVHFLFYKYTSSLSLIKGVFSIIPEAFTPRQYLIPSKKNLCLHNHEFTDYAWIHSEVWVDGANVIGIVEKASCVVLWKWWMVKLTRQLTLLIRRVLGTHLQLELFSRHNQNRTIDIARQFTLLRMRSDLWKFEESFWFSIKFFNFLPFSK